MSYTRARTGFAQARKQGRVKPFDERIEIAMRRFKAALLKMGGTINVRSRADMVDFGVKNVYNRDRELGDIKKGEFKKLIVEVVKRLLNTSCKHDTERGLLILDERFVPRRQHRQKYPRGPQVHARA